MIEAIVIWRTCGVLFRRDRILELRTGGTVVGALPQVSFRRGHVRLDPGSVLVLLTDGIVDRRDRATSTSRRKG